MQPASNTAGMKVLLVQDQSSSTAPASTSQTSDIGPQATNQNDPYMGNEHYDENYYGNADGEEYYHGYPDHNYYGQGYGADL